MTTRPPQGTEAARTLAEFQQVSEQLESMLLRTIEGFQSKASPPKALIRQVIDFHARYRDLMVRAVDAAGTNFRLHASIHRKTADLTDLGGVRE